MCLQDLRISRRTSRRVIPIDVSGGGTVAVPIDLTRVSRVIVFDSEGNTVISAAPALASPHLSPYTNTQIVKGGEADVYTRETLGALVSLPAWIVSESAGTVSVVVEEYDAETMHEIYAPLRG